MEKVKIKGNYTEIEKLHIRNIFLKRFKKELEKENYKIEDIEILNGIVDFGNDETSLTIEYTTNGKERTRKMYIVSEILGKMVELEKIKGLEVYEITTIMFLKMDMTEKIIEWNKGKNKSIINKIIDSLEIVDNEGVYEAHVKVEKGIVSIYPYDTIELLDSAINIAKNEFYRIK